MMDFSDQVISGSYKGIHETKITDIVNIESEGLIWAHPWSVNR